MSSRGKDPREARIIPPKAVRFNVIPGRPARPHEETTPDQYSHVERPAPGRRSAQLQLRWIEGGLGELHLHRLEGLEHDLRDGEVAEPFPVGRDDVPGRP